MSDFALQLRPQNPTPTALELHRLHIERVQRMNARAMPAPRVAVAKSIPSEPQPIIAPAPAPAPAPIAAKATLPLARPSIKTILTKVCAFYGVNMVDLISERRTANIIWPRHVAMYIAKSLTFNSLPSIGRAIGGRDHSTILHAVRKVAYKLKIDEWAAIQVAEIESEFSSIIDLADLRDPSQAAARTLKRLWTPDEVTILRACVAANEKPKDVAEKFCRTPTQVRGKAVKLGIPFQRRAGSGHS